MQNIVNGFVFFDETCSSSPIFLEGTLMDLKNKIPDWADYCMAASKETGSNFYRPLENVPIIPIGKKYTRQEAQNLFACNYVSDTGFYLVSQSGHVHPISYQEVENVDYLVL